MDERFKIVFEAVTDKFEQKTNSIKQTLNDFGERAKLNIGVSNKSKAEIKYLKAQIKEIEYSLQMSARGIEVGDVLKLKKDLASLQDRLDSMHGSQVKFFDGFKKGFDGGLKKVKRFALALFGIHSIYRLLSRASSAYLAQDTETANKLKAAWIGLGSIFAPVLKWVADFVIKAVKYLDIFWKAFTGKGFLTNAMEKATKKATSAVKALNKQLAGFDEITNIGDTGGGGLATPDWTEAFKGIEVNAELANKITELGKAFRDLWSKYIEPFKNDWGKLWDILGKPLATFVLSSGLLFDLLLGNWIGAIVKFGLLIVIHWKDIWDTLKSILKTSLSIIGGILTTIVQLFLAPFTALWKSLTDIFNNIKKIFTGIIDFIAGVFTGNWQRVWQGIINIFSGIFGGLWAIVKYPINLIIEGLNAFIRGLNKIKFDIPSWVPLIGGKAFGININPIPPLATGTNYVPSDMIANIHKGEAVIPKKFNKAEFFGGGNEETNSLLAKLIEKVEQIEINPYTEIKDVGKATTRYTKNRRRILGTEGV